MPTNTLIHDVLLLYLGVIILVVFGIYEGQCANNYVVYISKNSWFFTIPSYWWTPRVLQRLHYTHILYLMYIFSFLRKTNYVQPTLFHKPLCKNIYLLVLNNNSLCTFYTLKQTITTRVILYLYCSTNEHRIRLKITFF